MIGEECVLEFFQGLESRGQGQDQGLKKSSSRTTTCPRGLQHWLRRIYDHKFVIRFFENRAPGLLQRMFTSHCVVSHCAPCVADRTNAAVRGFPGVSDAKTLRCRGCQPQGSRHVIGPVQVRSALVRSTFPISYDNSAPSCVGQRAQPSAATADFGPRTTAYAWYVNTVAILVFSEMLIDSRYIPHLLNVRKQVVKTYDFGQS